jgi:hypothetical protein
MSFREIRRLRLETLRDPVHPNRQHGLTDAQVWELVDALGCIEHMVDEFGTEREAYVSAFDGMLRHVYELHARTVAYDRLREGDPSDEVHAWLDAEVARIRSPRFLDGES